MYKPVLLSLTTVLVCIAVWLTVLTLTGKRRDKIRRLLRREQFVTEVEARGHEDTSSQDVDSVASSVNEMEVVGTETSKVRSGKISLQEVGGPMRSGKISLPARMTDLYQSYPGDKEGMVIPETVHLPEIVLTRPSIASLSADSQTKVATNEK